MFESFCYWISHSAVRPSGNPSLIDVKADGADPLHTESESSHLKFKLHLGILGIKL